jgi:molybdate/tungstate transport system substrate-binding protein
MRGALAALMGLASFGALLGASSADTPPGQVVHVLYAGSLVTPFEKQIVPALAVRGYALEGEARGSVANANMIRAGLKSPDIFISADAGVTEKLLSGADAPIAWYVSFATTRLAIAYSPASPFAARFRDAQAGRVKWYDVLRTPGLKLGRTDPAVDPKGYRTILAMELADRLYHLPLRERILGADGNPAQILPEETLLTRLEGGDLDAAFVYTVESTTRKLPTVDLPPEIDLGDPKFAARYREVSVTVNGTAHVGEPIAYALTIPKDPPNPQGALAVVRFLLGEEGRKILDGAGLTLTPLAFHGDLSAVPADLRGSQTR